MPYLDNAATTFPKPPHVTEAVTRYLVESGTAYGRGGSRRGMELKAAVDRCRLGIAHLLGISDPRRIVFTFSGTDGLNLAIRGLLRPGDHVITSVMEHNSVLRPLSHLETEHDIQVTRIDCNDDGLVDPEAIREALSDETRLVILMHASNVTGRVQPIVEVGEIVSDSDAFFLVDAAQTVGAMPLDVTAWRADLVVAPGHKGLLGPLGTGIVYLREGIEETLQPLRFGGTGSRSELETQPMELPDRYEAGNHNVPGLVGLAAGVEWIRERTVEAIRDHERELTERLLDGLEAVPDLAVITPQRENRIGIVSVTHSMYPPDVLSTILDDSFDIQTRAGLHCAPGMHRRLGTLAEGGTLRLSIGPLTIEEDIDQLVSALHAIVEG